MSLTYGMLGAIFGFSTFQKFDIMAPPTHDLRTCYKRTSRRKFVQGGPSGRGTLFVDIKFVCTLLGVPSFARF